MSANVAHEEMRMTSARMRSTSAERSEVLQPKRPQPSVDTNKRVHSTRPFIPADLEDADTMIHFEHPARAEEFAAVAVLATLAYAADETGSALPPLWPMVLHSSFTDLILPVPGADADAWSSDAASIPELIRALRSLIPAINTAERWASGGCCICDGMQAHRRRHHRIGGCAAARTAAWEWSCASCNAVRSRVGTCDGRVFGHLRTRAVCCEHTRSDQGYCKPLRLH
jgi:hypothetical protein